MSLLCFYEVIKISRCWSWNAFLRKIVIHEPSLVIRWYIHYSFSIYDQRNTTRVGWLNVLELLEPWRVGTEKKLPVSTFENSEVTSNSIVSGISLNTIGSGLYFDFSGESLSLVCLLCTLACAQFCNGALVILAQSILNGFWRGRSRMMRNMELMKP